MTALFAPPLASLYEPTVPVLPERPERGRSPAVFERFIVLPGAKAPTAPRVQQLLARLQVVTGWSARTTAQALGTTHPTVSALSAGRQASTPRIPEFPGRLVALVELAERLARVADGEVASVDAALRSIPPGQTRSAVDHLRSGDLGRAYTTALDVLEPPRRGGMMRSVWPARPGEATAALDDEPV